MIKSPLDERVIAYNARIRGFPLFGTERIIAEEILVEELIVGILRNVTEPRYVEGLPVVIAKNRIDYDDLVRRARQEKMTNHVGWILDEARAAFERKRISYDQKISWAIKTLENEKQEGDVFLDNDREPYWIEDSKQRRTECAARWGVVAIYPKESFDKNLITYRCAPNDRQG
ncbi:hypothetical protein HY489_00805 [Candidatus Woesearchaeota archaeon]|nr:hypothetical protein [Candidatus Woesearchaeota archaeon]